MDWLLRATRGQTTLGRVLGEALFRPIRPGTRRHDLQVRWQTIRRCGQRAEHYSVGDSRLEQLDRTRDPGEK